MVILAAQVVATLWSLTLAVLLVDRARRRGGWFLCVVAATMMLSWGLSSWAQGDETATSMWNVPLHLSAVLLLATYPNGRLFPRWAAVPAGGMMVIQFGNAFSGWRWDLVQPTWPLVMGMVYLALLAAQLVRTVRRSTSAERRMSSWVLLAGLVQVVTFTISVVLAAGILGSVDSPPLIALSILLNGLIGTGFAFGLLWPHAIRVDRALRDVIAFTIVACGVLAVASAVNVLLAEGAPSPTASLWVAAALVAVGVIPLARFGSRCADVLVYRGRPEPLALLERLGTQLESGPSEAAVPGAIVRAIGEALHLQGVRLVSDDASLASTWGDGEAVATFDVVHAGEIIARLEVAPRAAEDALTEHDRLVIGHLVRQSASVLGRARARAELAEARRRLVHLREDERRRLRRDLHDDLAPAFAGLGMSAGALAEILRASDPRAQGLAAHLAADLAATSQSVRALAYDLRPPILDDRGLIAAIEDRTGGDPPVRVEAPEVLPSMPAAVESAALRIVQEAVANTRRHSAASVCVVRVSVTSDALEVEVDDDGCGFPDRRVDGIGLRSMRERAAELDGLVRFSRADLGGARVRATLPLTGSVP